MTETAPEAPEVASYDPNDDTVDGVHAYLQANPGDVERVLGLEKDGKARKGILSYTVEDAQADADQAAAELAQPEPWSPESAGLPDDEYDRVVVYP